jgi:energy-coupling factor transport system ATP-binding protein
VALVRVERLTSRYAEADAPALEEVSLRLEAGEIVALLGPSGSGKTTLLRALAGLVPHFHGGSFAGRVEVGGLDTRVARPADLAGTVATVFQDPEDQVVMTRVLNEVAFGVENLGTAPKEIRGRVHEALDALGILHLAGRATHELSGGELQRVCLAAALALRPSLLLLDEPTSQLDPDAADAFLARLRSGLGGAAVVLSEQRTARAIAIADRVLFVERGRLVLDAARDEAVEWLAAERPAFAPGFRADVPAPTEAPSDAVVTIDNAWFSYAGLPAVSGTSLAVRRGEVVALEGPNGSGKSTLAKLAVGLLEPDRGTVTRSGRGGYLTQDPGRYLARDRVLDEVALGVGGDRGRARAALDVVGLGWAAERHPRDLSSGERERLGLAAVAVAEPDLLVLDEPTRGVDPARKAELARWLHAYAAAGRGVLVATHDRGFPAHRRIALGLEEVLVAA